MALGIEGLSPADILKRPYHRVVVPDEDGSFSAEISEFPGCIATGDTAVEALSALEEVALSWIEVALANRQTIPAPEEEPEYSGKTVLLLPRSLHREASRAAKRDVVSLNQLIVTAVASYIGSTGSAHAHGTISAGSYTNVLVLPQQNRGIVQVNYVSNASDITSDRGVSWGGFSPAMTLIPSQRRA